MANRQKVLDFDKMKLPVGRGFGKGYNSWFWRRDPFTGEAFKVALDNGASALGISDAFVSRTVQHEAAQSKALVKPVENQFGDPRGTHT